MIDFEKLLKEILVTAESAFGSGWDHIKTYAPAEFKKLAVQVVAIAENIVAYQKDPSTGYPADTGKVLLQMQRNALEGVLTAVTALTIISVQDAINKVLTAIRNAFGGVLTAFIAA